MYIYILIYVLYQNFIILIRLFYLYIYIIIFIYIYIYIFFSNFILLFWENVVKIILF